MPPIVRAPTRLSLLGALVGFVGCDAAPPTPTEVRLDRPTQAQGAPATAPTLDPSWLPRSAARLPAPLLIGVADGALLVAPPGDDASDVAWTEPAPITAAALPAGWSAHHIAAAPGATVTLTVDGVALAATAGTLPGPATQRPLAESPDACGDRRFPARVAGGLATCSAPGTLDRWGDTPLPGPVRPAEATAAGWSLALAGAALGAWSPTRNDLHGRQRHRLAQHPATGGGQIAVAEDGRLLIGAADSGARTVLAADLAEPPTVSATHAAWIDAQGDDHALILRQHRPASHARVPGTTAPTQPRLDAGWLTWVDSGRVHGLGLRGQPSWSVPLDAGFTDGATGFDDWRLVPDRSTGRLRAVAVHVASGVVVPAWDAGADWVRLRGADASGITAAVGPPGATPRLAERVVRVRVLEEDGAVAEDGLIRMVGGHGGRHGLLAAGQSHDVTLPPGPGARLSVWVPAGSGSVAIRRGAHSVTVPIDPGPPRWIDLGDVLRGEAVRVRWTAGPDSLGVDALRLVHDE